MTNPRQPNLFVVGSMKSGTTTLYNYLDSHPQIFMSKRPWKEPRYFVKEMNWSKGEDWYLSLFESADKELIIGEASHHYSWIPHYSGVPERIHKFNPEARIFYIMRDPVERTISQYWWEVQWSGEGRDMLTAVKKMDDLIDVSNYAMQLQPYIKLFGRERVMAITLEELNSSTSQTLYEIFTWLGVDSSFLPTDLNRRDNISSEKVDRMFGSSIFSNLRGTLLWKAMKRVVSESTRQQVRKAFSRPVERDMSGLEETINYLRPIQQEQTQKLCKLLGREFSEWKTLYDVT